MQKCDKCNMQLKWSEIYRSLWWIYRPIQCNNCGTKHQIMFSSRILAAFLFVFPWWFLDLFLSNLTILSIIMINILIVVFISFFIPFLMKYSSEYK